VNELNEKFLAELGTVESPIRIGDEAAKTEEVRLVFVGCSHATRLATAAAKMDLQHSVVNLSGNKITAAAVEEAAMKLKEIVNTAVGKVTIVYSIFDNNSFFAVSDDGTKMLPVKIGDGDGGDKRYHVPGRLEVADHTVYKALVNTSIPLLRAGGEMEKIIFSPLPRYLIPCCGDDTHITNRSESGFREEMMAKLAEAKKSIRDLVFGKKLRNFKVMDPLHIMYGGENGGEGQRRGLWRLNPVHPSEDGYDSLLNGIMTERESISFNRQHASGAGGGKRTLFGGNHHHRRQSWVSEDDNTTRHVYDTNTPRGGTRGRMGKNGASWRGRGGEKRGDGCSGRGWRGGNRGGGYQSKFPRGYKQPRNNPY
jgi:hypothetical protein